MRQEKFVQVRRLTDGLTRAVILIACLVLFGWAFDGQFIQQFIPGLIKMNPTTASLFILTACGVYCINDRSPQANLLGKNLGLVIASLAFVRFLGFNSNWDIGIDQFLFREKLLGNRMAADTIFNFLLLGAAIFLIDKRSRKNLVVTQALALVTFIMSLWAVVGYIYAAGPLYQFPRLSPMAIHTAFTFLLIAAAVLLSRPNTGFVSTFLNKNLGGVIFRKLLPFVIGVPVITGFLRLQGQKIGLFNQEFGSALAIIFIVSVFSFLMWWLAKSLNHTDQERKTAERNLLRATEELKKSESLYRSLIEN